jgi:poly-gamma-glutamate capsule biosynthesis protein CapA/YwtB (metallophosphatase superfamily)
MRKDSDPGAIQRSQARRGENAGGETLSRIRADFPSTRLTRRELLVAAAATTLAGCSQDTGPRATTTPKTPFALGRTATLYSDGTVPSALSNTVTQLIRDMDGIPDVTFASSLTPAPDLILTFGKLPTGYTSATIGTSPLTVLTHLRVPVDGITTGQAQALLGGTVTDWSALGAPYSLPVHLFALQGLALPPGVPQASNAQTIASAEALLSAVRAQAGSVALVPLELADWSARNLGIDGHYPTHGDVTQAPFAPLTLRIGAANKLVARGLNVRDLAARLETVVAMTRPTFDMLVAGDIILGRGVNNKMVAYHDYLYPFRKVRDEFMSADWRVANLECTITDLVSPPTDPYTFTFVTSKRAVEGLVYAGIQTVSVANNHADNAGVTSFLDMLNTLHEKQITTCGGGSNLAEARQPAIQTVKGTQVALLAYNEIPPGGPYAHENSPGIAPVDLTTLPQDIAAARAQADLVIPFFHWGIEYTKDPTTTQQQAARLAIDSGADMVLGSHPHWVQAIESYKGRLIIYCLGNFVFDQDWSRETIEGCMLHLYWRGTTLAGIRFVPYLIKDRCQPNLISQAEAVDIFERMWSGTDMLASGRYGPEPEP